MATTIKTNNVPRELIDAWQLTQAEQAEFDYLDWAAIAEGGTQQHSSDIVVAFTTLENSAELSPKAVTEDTQRNAIIQTSPVGTDICLTTSFRVS